MELTENRKKVFTFLVTGSFVALFQYASFHVLWREWGIGYLFASSLSFFLTVILSFYIQKYVTFRAFLRTPSQKTTIVSFTLFGLNAFLGLAVNGCIMFLGSDVWGFSPYSVQAFSMVVLASYNFFIYQIILR